MGLILLDHNQGNLHQGECEFFIFHPLFSQQHDQGCAGEEQRGDQQNPPENGDKPFVPGDACPVWHAFEKPGQRLIFIGDDQPVRKIGK